MSLSDYIINHKKDLDFIDNPIEKLRIDFLNSNYNADLYSKMQYEQLILLLEVTNFFKEIFSAKKDKTDLFLTLKQISNQFMNVGLTTSTFSFFISLSLFIFDFINELPNWINPFQIEFPKNKETLTFKDFGYGTNIETNQDFEIVDGVLFSTRLDFPVLYIPKEVHTISEHAFEGKSVKIVFIHKNIKVIEAMAFKDCKFLTSVYFEEDLKNINNGVFENCNNLTFINGLEKIELVGKDAFKNTKLSIFKEKELISQRAFLTILSQLNQFEKLELDSIEALNSLRKDSVIQTLVLSENVKTIQPRSFEGMNIEKLVLESNEIHFQKSSFDQSIIKSINIKDPKYRIIEEIFLCYENQLITVLNNDLKAISFPKEIEIISTGSINELQYLEDVSFHTSIKVVEKQSFIDCKNLSKCIFEGNNLLIFDKGFALNSKIKKLELKSQIVHPIKDVFNDVEEINLDHSIDTIFPFQFSNLTHLKKINLEKVKRIDDFAFLNCSSVSSMTLSSIEYIGFGAFSQCHQLESLELLLPRYKNDSIHPHLIGAIFDVDSNENHKEIIQISSKGKRKYYIPKQLVEITILSSEIPSYFLSGLNNLNLKFEKPIQILHEYALFNTAIDSIELNNDAQLKSLSLAECRNLLSIENLENAIIVEPNVFRNCISLNKLNIHVSNYELSLDELNTLSSLEILEISSIADENKIIKNNLVYDLVDRDIVYIPPKFNPTTLVISDIENFSKSLLRYFNQLETLELLNVRNIHDEAFSDMPSLKKLSISKETQTIGKNILNESLNIEELTLPFLGFSKETETISSFISYYTKSKLPNLKTLNIEAGLISRTHFQYLDSLKSIFYNGDDANIGDNAFKNLSKLEKVEFQNEIVTIGESAFENCYNILFDIADKNISNVGKYAFKNCYQLASLNFGNNIKYIGANAYENCKNIHHISLPNCDVNIMDNAFDTASKLDYVRVPIKNNRIDSIFGEDYQIEKLVIFADELHSGFLSNNLYIRSIKIEGKLKSIPIKAFENCQKLEEVIILAPVETIEDGAFMSAKNLKSILGLHHISEIKNYAFQDCFNLEEISLPDVRYIENSAFKNNKSLAIVNLGNAVKIGHHCFENCISLTNIQGTEHVSEIGQSAFKNCTKISSISLPSLNIIREEVFNNCESLKYFDVSNECKIIETNAFKNCINLKKITIPMSVNYIDNFVFENSFQDLIIIINKRSQTKAYQKYWNYKTQAILDENSFFKKMKLNFSDKYTTIKE